MWSGNTEQLRNTPSIASVFARVLQHIERTNSARGVLGKRRHLRCGQPLSVDLDQKVFKFLEDETDRCSYVSSQLLYRSVICERLGVAPEVGVYSRGKMSDPAYKPPLRFRLALRLQKGRRGAYKQDTTVCVRVTSPVTTRMVPPSLSHKLHGIQTCSTGKLLLEG